MCSVAGLPSPGSELTLLVSRVNASPLCNMVEFWGNFRKDKKHIYDLLRREVQCYGERERSRFQEREGNQGDQCLVQVFDTWYRARVVSRTSSDYSVFLFDEGRTLNVKANTLAWGDDEHFVLPPEVELCVLANVLPLSTDKWSPMALEFLRSLCGKTVNAYVQDVFASQRAHVLDIPSVSRQMLEMGFAKKLPPERFREFVVACLNPPGTDSSPSPAARQISPTQTSDKLSQPRQVEMPLTYLYPELQTEMVETVTVTEVTNPSRIFCQLRVFSQELKKLTDQITKHYEDRIATGPPPRTLGSPCAARGPDGKWYRGVLQQVMAATNVAEVLYVDSGKKHFTPLDGVRHLAAEFFRMPVVTYMCSLLGVVDKGVGWTASQIDFLKSLLMNKTLIAKFEYQNLSEGVHYVTLFGVGSKNLNKEFGTHAECLMESEKIGVDFSINKQPSQRPSPSPCGEVLDSKTSMPEEIVSVNSTQKAVVQYVKNPTEFWVHIQKHAEEFDQLMNDMELYYKSEAAVGFTQNPQVGVWCAALSEDGTYYRAKVQTVNGRQTSIFFIDYGNTEIVDIQNLRQLPSKYQMLPPLAVKCSLTGIKPECNGWSTDALNFFSDSVVDRLLDLHIVSKIEDKYTVQLSDPDRKNEKDISNLLCSAGMALKATDQCKTTKVVPSRNATLVPKAGRSVFKECLFTIGSSVEVTVCHIDSPSDFWCQVASSRGHLTLLMQDIQRRYTGSEYQEFDDTACVALHPERGMWYRALIIYRHQTPHVDVVFVDYGQTRKVPLHDLRPIMPSFLNLRGQAFRCSLYNLVQSSSKVSHEWDSNAKHLFKQFVDNAQAMHIILKCTVYAVMFDKQGVVYNVVDLETPFQSVCSQLVQSGLAVRCPQKKSAVPFHLNTYFYSTHNIKMGSEEELVVTAAKGVNQFYCQLSRDSEVMQDLTDKVNDLCKQLQSVQCPMNFGTVCFAKYTDGEWYRGKILSTNPSIMVHFVDYGNAVEVDKSDLLPVPIEAGDVMAIPVQSIECGLSDVPDDVPSEVDAWFNNYVVDHLLKAVIVAKEPNGKLLVELYDGNTQINGLLKQKFASELRRKPEAVVEQETKATAERDFARVQKAPADYDWRKRPSQDGQRGDGDVKPKTKVQFYDAWQKQHTAAPITERGDSWRSSTKMESKVPVSDFSEHPLNRGDCQSFGKPHSSALASYERHGQLKSDSHNKENENEETWLEEEKASTDKSEKQHITPPIMEKRDSWRTSTKMESKVPVSNFSEHPRNRGDCQSFGKPHSSAPASLERHGQLKSDTQNKENENGETWLEEEKPSTDKAVSRPTEFKVGSRKPEKHETPAVRASQILPKLSDLPSKMIAPGMEVEVFVSHWNNPSSFFVQLVSDEDSINSLIFNDQDTTSISTKDIQEGALVKAEFADDQSWYRAVVKAHIDSDSYQVEFIDFGNGAHVSSSKICRLDQSSLDHPRLSIQCCLRGSMISGSEKFSDALKTEIDEIDGALKCTFIQESKTGWEVSLVANGKRLEDRLHTTTSAITSVLPIEKRESAVQDNVFLKDAIPVINAAVLYKKAALSKGQTLDVFASSISGPEDFWCQCSVADKLQELSELAQHAGNDATHKSLDTVSIQAGNACLALFSDDEQWYRAEILSKEGDSVSVLFIDYGNESHVNTSNTKALPMQLQEIPPQSFLCQLDGFDPSRGSWKEDAADQFLELVDDKPLKLTILQPIELENGKVSYMVRVECEGQILNELMKEYWCSSASGGSIETRDPTSPDPEADIPSHPLTSELKCVPVSEELACRVEDLSHNTSDGLVPAPEAQRNVHTFPVTLDENANVTVLPVIESPCIEEGPEQESVDTSNQEESVRSLTQSAAYPLAKAFVQELISDAVNCSVQSSVQDDSERPPMSTASIIQQDLNQATEILCIDKSSEETSTLPGIEGDGEERSNRACGDRLVQADETTPATDDEKTPEASGSALEEDAAVGVVESDLGKLQRAVGVQVGAECIIRSQATQTWCRASVLNISKETVLVVLQDQDSQVTVDPQSVFEVVEEGQTENSTVHTDAAHSDNLTQALAKNCDHTSYAVDLPLPEEQPEEFDSSLEMSGSVDPVALEDDAPNDVAAFDLQQTAEEAEETQSCAGTASEVDPVAVEDASDEEHKITEHPTSIAVDTNASEAHSVPSSQPEVVLQDQDSQVMADPQNVFEDGQTEDLLGDLQTDAGVDNFVSLLVSQAAVLLSNELDSDDVEDATDLPATEEEVEETQKAGAGETVAVEEEPKTTELDKESSDTKDTVDHLCGVTGTLREMALVTGEDTSEKQEPDMSEDHSPTAVDLKAVAWLELLDFSPKHKMEAGRERLEYGRERGDVNLIDLTSDTEDSDTGSEDTVKDANEDKTLMEDISQSMEDLLSRVTHLSLRTEMPSDDYDDQ
ncbi:tudor domain-containing 6 isoform X2 [Engraulis encrasicolus]|uniref:tudor domain-containing 6 isoform X2 n=1 Tax=Engraulis encrasicolus TaxID=184585 RepID=UPI002FD1D4BD